MKTSKYFVVATLFATLSFVFLSCEDKKHQNEFGTENGYEDVIWYNFDSRTKTASVTYKGKSYTTFSNEYTGEVVIPSTVTYEGKEYSVTSIESYAFRECDSLTSVTIPESVTSIGEEAFCWCSSLTSITLPEGVTSIGENVFCWCSSLTSITIPESVTEIANSAFYACESLTSITLPEGVTSIGGAAFQGCSSLTSITLPEGVTSIEDYAFCGCSSLTSIIIPEGATIGKYAFYECYSLKSITCKNTTPPEVNSYTFLYVDKSIPLYVPAESVEAYKNAKGWKDFTNIQAIP